jgi:hypothetical protein
MSDKYVIVDDILWLVIQAPSALDAPQELNARFASSKPMDTTKYAMDVHPEHLRYPLTIMPAIIHPRPLIRFNIILS